MSRGVSWELREGGGEFPPPLEGFRPPWTIFMSNLSLNFLNMPANDIPLNTKHKGYQKPGGGHPGTSTPFNLHTGGILIASQSSYYISDFTYVSDLINRRCFLLSMTILIYCALYFYNRKYGVLITVKEKSFLKYNALRCTETALNFVFKSMEQDVPYRRIWRVRK